MTTESEIPPADWHEVQPPAVLRTPKVREIKYIRPEEARRIISVLEGRNKLLVEILWNTGARVSEVLELTPSSVNFELGTITFKSLKKKRKLSPKAKQLKNQIRGVELALKEDPGSKILARKLKEARKKLATFNKEPPPPAYRTVPIKGELAGKIASYCMSNNVGPNERLFPISRIWVYKILQEAGERPV